MTCGFCGRDVYHSVNPNHLAECRARAAVRDDIATAAVPVLLRWALEQAGGRYDDELVAKEAWALADAVLAQRDKDA